MATFSERFRSLRNDRGWSQQQLADELGISKSSVNMYERGAREPGFETMEIIADLFNVDMDYLYGRSNIKLAQPVIIKNNDFLTDPAHIPGLTPYHPSKRIPILGRVAAGLPLLAEENIEGYTSIDFDDDEVYYALRVRGDSMNAVGINDGDLVVVRQQSAVDDGQIAVVLVNGDDATIKYIKQEGNLVFLTPKSYNPAHQIQVYNLDETPVHIIGRVVSCQRYY